jgi:hypothetical protein
MKIDTGDGREISIIEVDMRKMKQIIVDTISYLEEEHNITGQELFFFMEVMSQRHAELKKQKGINIQIVHKEP